jgi:hypothetical protein
VVGGFSANPDLGELMKVGPNLAGGDNFWGCCTMRLLYRRGHEPALLLQVPAPPPLEETAAKKGSKKLCAPS